MTPPKDPLGNVFTVVAGGVHLYDELIMSPLGCPPLPQARNPLPVPLPLLLLRLVVPFPTSLNKLCHFPLLQPQPVVPLTRGRPPGLDSGPYP